MKVTHTVLSEQGGGYIALLGYPNGEFVKRIFATLTVAILLLGVLWKVSKNEEFQLFGNLINRIDTPEKIVALTFDDGPMKDQTDQILEFLDKADIKATFFLVGKAIKDNPQAAKNIVEEGHEIGNHSYSHSRMVFKSLSFVAEEIEKTNQLITQSGYKNIIHFRPPYGKKLFSLPFYLYQNEITTITWDVAPESFLDAKASPEKISEYVVKNTRPGSIILLHVMFQSRINSMAAVPNIIKKLKAKGYKFVTVSELIASDRI